MPTPGPVFSVVKSTDVEWETAPYVIRKGDEVFLEGIQLRAEAEDICGLLNQPLKVVPINTNRPRWLPGGRGGRHREAGSILIEAAMLIPLFIFLFLSAADLILAETAKSNVGYLAQNAANCTLQPGCNPAAYVSGAASGLSMNNTNLSVTAGKGTATVNYTTTPIGPFFPSLNLKSTAMAVAP
jgi:hypothetical protein